MQAACALEQIMRDGYEYDVQECLRSMCVWVTHVAASCFGVDYSHRMPGQHG